MSSSPVLSAEQRAWQYWFADGFSSLIAGTACLLFAFSRLYTRHRTNSPFVVALGFLALLLYCVILLRQEEIIDWLKSRLIYPRTGYVRPPYIAEDASLPLEFTTFSLREPNAILSERAKRSRAAKRRLWITLPLIFPALGVLMFVRSPWICPVAGLLLAVALWFSRQHEQPLSWIVLAGFPLAGLCMALFLPLASSNQDRTAYLLAGGGILFVLDGAISLIRYLRANPRSAPAAS